MTVRIQKEVRIYVDCDSCGCTEYLGSRDMTKEEVIKIVTKPDRQVPVRKDGININYYDSRVWKLLERGSLICPACVLAKP